MRSFFWRMQRLLPVACLAIVGGCGVTDRQLADFATSTAVRVFAQSATSVLEAVLLQLSSQGTI